MDFRSHPLLFASILGVALSAVACGDTTGNGGAGAGQAAGGSGAGTSSGGGVPEGCVPITQMTDGTKLYSTGGVGFEVDPSQGSADIPDVVTVSPQNKGSITTGSSNLDGKFGLSIVLFSVDAVTDLINASPGDMDARLFIAVNGQITIDEAPQQNTQFKGRVKGTVSNVEFRELIDGEVVDMDGDDIPDGDCFYLETADFDAVEWTADCNAPVDLPNTPSGGACMTNYAGLGHECNPVNNDGCLSTEICDWGTYFQCYELMGDENGICGSCFAFTDTPTFCKAGMTCDSDADNGSCYRYCCTDADCGPGAACIAYSFAPIGVGVCLTK